KEDLPAWSPIVMTSTPNGRLFLFQCEGNQPKVYFSIAPVNGRVKPVMSPGYEVNYVDNGLKITHNLVNNKSVDLFLQLFHPTVSRVSADLASSKIRAAYHSLDADGMQETRVILIDVRNPRLAPVVTPVRTIRAENPRDYSVLYFNFIDPDYVDMPEGMMSNT